jgi:hypothetical protein
MADELVLSMVAGEDYSAQLFWTDEYGGPIPVTDPVLLDVKDANGQLALRFTNTDVTGLDPAANPSLVISGYVGYFQITCPSAITRTLVPGRYQFDLFAAIADSAPPFDHQIRQVLSGWVDIASRVTQVEAAASSVGP